MVPKSVKTNLLCPPWLCGPFLCLLTMLFSPLGLTAAHAMDDMAFDPFEQIMMAAAPFVIAIVAIRPVKQSRGFALACGMDCALFVV